MKVTKWVQPEGMEVEVEVSAEDIRLALAEAFEAVTGYRQGEEGPNRYTVLRALGSIGTFLNALTDENIAGLLPGQRAVIAVFLLRAHLRFGTLPTATESEKS